MQFARNFVRHGLRTGLRCAPVVGSPTPRLGRNTGAICTAVGLRYPPAFFRAETTKKDCTSGPGAVLEKPFGLNPIGGFTISRRVQRLSKHYSKRKYVLCQVVFFRTCVRHSGHHNMLCFSYQQSTSERWQGRLRRRPPADRDPCHKRRGPTLVKRPQGHTRALRS